MQLVLSPPKVLKISSAYRLLTYLPRSVDGHVAQRLQ